MNNIQHQPNNMREKVVGLEEKRNKSPNNGIGDEEEASLLQLQESPHDELYQLQAIKQQQQHLPAVAAAAAITAPPSASSSPTHEFSFTISLQPAQPIKINNDKTAKLLASAPPQPSPPQPFAIDLSPADDIFFHGHLLPLHLLAHLPVSPRSSTNSLDSFTLPIKELLQVQDHVDQNYPTPSTSINNDTSFRQAENSEKGRTTTTTTATTTRVKSKSFSIFGIPKWRKTSEERDQKEEELEDRDYCSNSFSYKKKLKLEVTNVLKRYARMVRPLLPFGGSKRSKMEFQRQPYSSYSGNILSGRGKAELRRRRGEFSAPSSMRTSPTNSGILLATLSGTVSPTKSTSDSTMEELQAAIQAAITHCKNSIAMDVEDHA